MITATLIRLLAATKKQSEQISTLQATPPGSGTPGSSATETTQFGLPASPGVSTAYSRADHTHGSPANPVTAHLSAYNHATFALGTDARFTDARLPLAHAHTNADISGTSAATSATTGAMTVSMTTDIITITPTGACTFNASGGITGRIITFHITTSGTSSFVMTFGTNFRKTGTLATGTTSARYFSVTFRCINGTIWSEMCRTAAQT